MKFISLILVSGKKEKIIIEDLAQGVGRATKENTIILKNNDSEP